MEAAIGAASGLIGSVLNQLSSEFVDAYVASTELGLNSTKIKDDLMLMHGLLHEAQRRGVSDNLGLQGLLQRLRAKANEAENALDELHYFIIQDRLDGTKYAVPDLGDGLRARAHHGRHAAHNTLGNWLNCFSCSPMQDDGEDGASNAAVTNNPHNASNLDSGNNIPVDRLPFDRVVMSKKIKSVIEETHSLCEHVFKLLDIIPNHSSTAPVTLTRPQIGSTTLQDKLYGRSAIFEQTMKDMTSGAYHSETLSVLPIVGPGGIGKTTFTQHLYNDKRTQDHFIVRVWVCVSTSFDVLQLTQQIHNCIPATENGESNAANGPPNINQLQIGIAHRLKYKRFLIVLDDIWQCDSDDEWTRFLAPFTKSETRGSVIIVTTRFPKIKERVKKATNPINLQGLDPQEFFEFFQACVFGENRPDQQCNELTDIGREILKKLKCSPLAAKTVARLLKKHLSWEHWRKVLENNEWQNETNGDDIMPALKISYDNLPFHLKQCFSTFSLFPEDYRFKLSEITRFWTAIGIIDSSYKNKNYLEELVDNGFLMKEVQDNLEDPCYVMHDLLHELSRSVSSQECVNISSLSFSSDDIPKSIQHLSINIEDRYDDDFRKEMAKLKSRINIGNLRTFMIFRNYYEEKTIQILKDTFKEIEGLRVLFISLNSPEGLPRNFSKLLHLRYLKLRTPYYPEITLPSTLSRFYHLLYLDLEDWHGSSNLPKYISRLVNLRYFIAHRELHSNVPEVGKIEHLEELNEFHAKKESVGFEMEELGKLSNLGELRVCNLEKVKTKEEAKHANLSLKRNLKKLVLVWGTEQPVIDVDVVDGLQPHDNLKELVIKDYGGAIGTPSWLYCDMSIRHLQCLTLKGVSWAILPPFEQLPHLKRLKLKNIARAQLIVPDTGTCRNQSFMRLKEVVFINMPVLEKWTVEPPCHLFPVLESIECSDCPNLLGLPFWPGCSLSCTQDIHCPSLRSIKITACPKLLLPLMPPAPSLTSIEISSDVQCVYLLENVLTLVSYSGAVAFHNMSNVVSLSSVKGSITSWTDLQKATSLRNLSITGDSSMLLLPFTSNVTSITSLSLVNCDNLTVDGFNHLITLVNLKELVVGNDGNHPRSVSVDLLSEVARRFKQLPAGSFQLEKLVVDSILAVLIAPVCILLAATLHTLTICCDQRVESLTEDEEKSLQLLTSLQTLKFERCLGLLSLPQGLHCLSSLRKLEVLNCPEIQCLPKGGLPSSLYEILVWRCGAELHEQVKKLEGTNLELRVKA